MKKQIPIISFIPRRSVVAAILTLVTTGVSAFAGEIADEVVVKKKDRKLILKKGGVDLKTYRVALGGDPIGHKVKEGDNRTPEGDYMLDFRNSKSSFHKSIHISYPNAKDLAAAKKLGVEPGGDLFIHGMHNDMPNWKRAQLTINLAKDWTQGCIAVTDSEMEEIWTMVPDGTPIRIEP